MSKYTANALKFMSACNTNLDFSFPKMFKLIVCVLKETVKVVAKQMLVNVLDSKYTNVTNRRKNVLEIATQLPIFNTPKYKTKQNKTTNKESKIHESGARNKSFFGMTYLSLCPNFECKDFLCE